jgi:hypothetical protein
LYLKSTGLIGLPLQDYDAKAIVAASRQAPFGKGEQTIVDATIRKRWEVSPQDFELKNPKWQPFLKSVVAKFTTDLRVDIAGKGVTAELYNLLLYEDGAMLKAHQE